MIRRPFAILLLCRGGSSSHRGLGSSLLQWTSSRRPAGCCRDCSFRHGKAAVRRAGVRTSARRPRRASVRPRRRRPLSPESRSRDSPSLRMGLTRPEVDSIASLPIEGGLGPAVEEASRRVAGARDVPCLGGRRDARATAHRSSIGAPSQLREASRVFTCNRRVYDTANRRQTTCGRCMA